MHFLWLLHGPRNKSSKGSNFITHVGVEFRIHEISNRNGEATYQVLTLHEQVFDYQDDKPIQVTILLSPQTSLTCPIVYFPQTFLLSCVWKERREIKQRVKETEERKLEHGNLQQPSCMMKCGLCRHYLCEVSDLILAMTYQPTSNSDSRQCQCHTSLYWCKFFCVSNSSGKR
jgi:Rieske Fe-S protein